MNKYEFKPQISKMGKHVRDNSTDVGDRLYTLAQEKEDKLTRKRLEAQEEEASNAYLRMPSKRSHNKSSYSSRISSQQQQFE